MKKFIICLALILLASCDMSVKTVMYVSDIVNYLKAESKEKPLLFNCIVEFELPSKDRYNEEPDRFNNMLANAFYEAKDPYVTERDMKTILSAKGKVYFSAENTVLDSGVPTKNLEDNNTDASGDDNSSHVDEPDKSLIYFTCDEDAKYINVYLNFEKNKFYRLNAAVKEDSFQDIEIKDFNISIDIQNDFSDQCEIIVNSSYVNNEPVLYSKTFTVAKRDTLNIDLSEIFKEYTFYNGKECIIKIVKPEQKKKTVNPSGNSKPG